MNRGNSHAGKQDHRQAIADFSQAIRLDPNNAAPYTYRAKAYRALGDEANAARDDERAHKRGLEIGD